METSSPPSPPSEEPKSPGAPQWRPIYVCAELRELRLHLNLMLTHHESAMIHVRRAYHLIEELIGPIGEKDVKLAPAEAHEHLRVATRGEDVGDPDSSPDAA